MFCQISLSYCLSTRKRRGYTWYRCDFEECLSALFFLFKGWICV